jgi:hypothetical protein
MPDTVSSTGDDRIANNAARHTYRKLSKREQEDMTRIEDLGAAFIREICALEARGVPGDDAPLTMRNLELARQHAEDATMRAVRFITG